MLVPRSKFGSSLYNVPLLLALRLFYNASPFESGLQQFSHSHSRKEQDLPPFAPQEVSTSFVPSTFNILNQDTEALRSDSNPFTNFETISTLDWLARISTSPVNYAHYRLVSLTWTKALGSPLSHEFIQFVLEDICTGRRSRCLTHRHVDGGDTVLLGFDWTSGTEPSQHHALPLPLLSLTFDNGPTVSDFAKVLADITNRKPEYSVLREMCWWYAEAVVEDTCSKYRGTVKEWDFAHLRYSFIVRTSMLRRAKLVNHAEQFRKLNTMKMMY